jgi:hypothetical protein
VTLIEHTAYPRLKRTLTPKELDQIYTPTPAKIFLAHRTAKGPVATLGFLVHLKQGLRQFPMVLMKTETGSRDLCSKCIPTSQS